VTGTDGHGTFVGSVDGPAAPGTTTREASAVNAAGTQAAGISVTADGTTVPTLWECSAVRRLLASTRL
jgi:uncharacterized membrane protein